MPGQHNWQDQHYEDHSTRRTYRKRDQEQPVQRRSLTRRSHGICVLDVRFGSVVGPEALDRYRCPDRGGPGGQRCQLLVEHDTPVDIASLGGVFRAWIDGAETTLPPSLYRWFVSFPRDKI